MKLPRRQFLHLAAGAAALPAAVAHRAGANLPTRPVRIIVGFPAGGTADIVARLIGQWLSERLSQPFVVENRAWGRKQYRYRGCGSRAARRAYITLCRFEQHR